MCVKIKDRRTSGSGRHLSSQASSLSEGPQAAVNLCNTVLPCYISYHTHTQSHTLPHTVQLHCRDFRWDKEFEYKDN